MNRPKPAYWIDPSPEDCCEEYDMLRGPGGFACLLTEPEDRTWSRDGREVVLKLNEQAERIRELESTALLLLKDLHEDE